MLGSPLPVGERSAAQRPGEGASHSGRTKGPVNQLEHAVEIAVYVEIADPDDEKGNSKTRVHSPSRFRAAAVECPHPAAARPTSPHRGEVYPSSRPERPYLKGHMRLPCLVGEVASEASRRGSCSNRCDSIF